LSLARRPLRRGTAFAERPAVWSASYLRPSVPQASAQGRVPHARQSPRPLGICGGLADSDGDPIACVRPSRDRSGEGMMSDPRSPPAVGHSGAMSFSPNGTVESLAERVRIALESADISQFGEFLDPNVRWGAPDDPTPSCQSRSDVLAWYGRGRAAGRRARVVDVQVRGNRILVHLSVSERSRAGSPAAEHDRWQILTCARARVVDIRGVETREEAFARLAPTC
jgi:hypothetical protein